MTAHMANSIYNMSFVSPTSCWKKGTSSFVNSRCTNQRQLAVLSNRVCFHVTCTGDGSTNGNGRPGRGIQISGQGYKSSYSSGFFDEWPEGTKGQSSDAYIGGDFESELSESPSKRGGKAFGSRSGKLLHRNNSNKRNGEDPYRIVDGQKVYLDELDVITLLEPPPFLRPLQPSNYNHAAFLWKKIGDIPEERRHRLLDLLLPRHVTKMWELSKLRYDDPDLFAEDTAGTLVIPDLHGPSKPMVWDGRVFQVPWFLKLFSRFQKVFFIGPNKGLYGRVITGGKFLSGLSDRLAPLYFQVRRAESVMATEEPCDLVLEYGDGHLHLADSLPAGFARPVKHLRPFNDGACDYLRVVGPGVIVGQSWVEGKKLEQYPHRLFGDFILVQRFN